jgi:hypothetical protein
MQYYVCRCIVLFISLIFSSHSHSTDLDSFIKNVIVWYDNEFQNNPPVEIVYRTNEQIRVEYEELSGTKIPSTIQFMSLYRRIFHMDTNGKRRLRSIISLSTRYNHNDPIHRSILVHEIIHHIQFSTDRNKEICGNHLEKEAYEGQVRWLIEVEEFRRTDSRLNPWRNRAKDYQRC